MLADAGGDSSSCHPFMQKSFEGKCMKKITPVFGPQELFDGLHESCIIAVNYHYDKAVAGYSDLYFAFEQVAEYCLRKKVTKVPEIAMRRIQEAPDSQLVTDGMPSFYVGSSGVCTHKMAESDIPVWCNDVDDTCTAMGFINDCLRLTRNPKRWTVEDQKAGLLPEVGCDCIKEGVVVTILNVNERYVTYIDKNDTNANSGNVSINAVNSFLKPIETPAEKAARLRGEWVDFVQNEWDKAGAKGVFLEFIYDLQAAGKLPPVQAKAGDE